MLNPFTPKCRIIKGKYGWTMSVDDMSVVFIGTINAEYFKKHYKRLGYNVIYKDESNKK